MITTPGSAIYFLTKLCKKGRASAQAIAKQASQLKKKSSAGLLQLRICITRSTI